MKAARFSVSSVLVLAALASAAPAPAAGRGAVLEEESYWRRCYRFGPGRISPKALETEGEEVLGQGGLERARQQAVTRMRAEGIDPNRADWKQHVHLRVYRELGATEAPPADWAKVDFDDGDWPLRRHTFGGDVAPGSPEFLDRGVVSAFYRGRFVVRDLAAAGDLTLTMAYHGGVRVFVNGIEVARKDLPAGELAADTPALDYPAEAYRKSDPSLWRRTVGPVNVPAALLRKGTNVLTVEVRASCFHPILLTNRRQRNWCDPERPWPHAHVLALALTSRRPGAFAEHARPGGVQVWVQDMHHRTESTEFLPPGETMGAVRVVGARNGSYSAQIVVGTDKELTNLRVTAAPLRRAGGTESLPASCVGVSFPAPYPAKEFTLAKLGDARGLGGTFPDNRRLAVIEKMPGPAGPQVFDHLAAAPPARIPRDTCRPVWLSMRIPASARPGAYRGKVVIAADGIEGIEVPVEVEVLDWLLPEAKDFQTFVACEQNPYGVARQYNVPLWSDAHFKLLEASFRQIARVGSRWVNVPVLRNTEFGNRDDSMILWSRRKDGTLTFDMEPLGRYLDLAARTCGRRPAVNVVVVHGTKSSARPPAQPEVMVLDQATGRRSPLNVSSQRAEAQPIWSAFANAVDGFMTKRGYKGLWYWGFPADAGGDDPDLKGVLIKAAPEARWAVCPHALLMNLQYAQDKVGYYAAFLVPRYWGDWSRLRNDRGWKSKTLHLLSPRVDGTCLAMCTVSHPMAYRVVADQALARGRNGIARIAADGWAGVYFDGMGPRIWITGLPVLFTLWPGPNGAEPSARFEAMLEGIQETEARIFLEQAIDSGMLPRPLADKATRLLDRRLAQTTIFQPNILVHELEKYYRGWQSRSRELYQMAAEAAAAMKTAGK